MKIELLREKMKTYKGSDQEVQGLYQALEASYQQLQALSDQLNNSERHYELLIDNMRDIVWIMDTKGSILYINDVVEDILGYDKSQMIGRKLYDFMCPLHRYETGLCQACVLDMIDQEYVGQEMWMLHKDGKTRKVLEVNSSHVYYKGEIREIQGIARDVSKRIEYKRRLKKKNKYMNFIQDLSTSINQNLTFNNLDQLLDETCKKIVKTMNVDLCSLRLLEGDCLVLKAAYGRYKAVTCRPSLPLDDPVVQKTLATRQPFTLVVGDVKESFEDIQNVFKDDKISQMLILPLNTNDKTVGVLSIALGDDYEADHLPLYVSLANNIAFASEKTHLYKDLQAYYLDLIMTLIAAMEAKDPYTQGHSMRVSDFAVKIAKAMALKPRQVKEIELAGILHDIGKMGISNSILSKPGKLTAEEYDEIKQHPGIGIKILERIDLSKDIRDAILYHHLRVDLGGYPDPATLKAQPLYAKIIGAADALDAMTSNRAYKGLMNIEEVIDEFLLCRDSQFCPGVVKVLVDLLERGDIRPLTSTQS